MRPRTHYIYIKLNLINCVPPKLENCEMLLRTYVWSIALAYGCEKWIIGGTKRRLEVFEMPCYSRMLKI